MIHKSGVHNWKLQCRGNDQENEKQSFLEISIFWTYLNFFFFFGPRSFKIATEVKIMRQIGFTEDLYENMH